MNSNIFKHEDERRILIEWIQNTPFCTSKIVIAKSEVPIGNHWHNKKNEIFLLITGMAKKVVIGDKEELNITAPFKWVVPKGIYHSFILQKDSILLGVADKPFDPKDEICQK